MKLSKSVAELQREHVVLELECIDRMYLNAYVPQLTSEAGVAGFVRGHLGYRFASTKQVAEMTEAFVQSIMQFGLDHKIDLVRFKKGQRKDHVMQARLHAFKKKYQEGVVFIGVAQEKARVPRTVRKAFGNSTIPWIDYCSANVNFYYFYCLDEDFGPFFIKFWSYFPYTAKLCINGDDAFSPGLRISPDQITPERPAGMSAGDRGLQGVVHSLEQGRLARLIWLVAMWA